MGSNGGIIVFLTIAMTLVCGGFVYFYMTIIGEPLKAVKCTNDEATISFLINDEDKTVIMAGSALDPKTITVFNETAISARWNRKKKGTKIFLDRIAGRLEIETTDDLIEWDKEELTCNQVAVRF